MMLKRLLSAAFAMILAPTVAGLLPARAADEGTMVIGTVISVDRENGKITVGSETYTMDKQSGTSMMPAAGDKVALTYKDSGGQKIVTKIGQATQ
jgi:hypothetical protein